jgi:NADH-quinone oxidoreductase subunit G
MGYTYTHHMAAVQQEQTVNIVINDVELAVPKGELIVESVKRLGVEIPVFCYHPRMKPVGMCRMCLVEVGFKQPDGTVRKMPKPQAGCTLPASEGMVVYTDSEMVHRDRKGVLEFLLVNHPLDCPICDRGGECPLQNNTIFYGPSTSRFVEVKRHAHKAFPLSNFVTLDLERCIQCGRCVRFTEEISGDAQLAFRFRGANMQPSTFELTDFDSKFSGNVIEICPVGALTSAQYRFRSRPWDLETKPAVCTLCSSGCNIWLDHRVGKFVRVNGRTNEAINEEWTCDRGKFGHDFYNALNRPQTPLMRQGNEFVPVSWADAYEAILKAFSSGGNRVAGLVGGVVPNEGLYLFQRLFREAFHSNNIDHRWTKAALAFADRLENRLGIPTIQTPIADIESKTSMLVFASSLADELPMVYLRARKAQLRNACRVVVATDQPTEVDRFASVVLRYRPESEDALALGLLAEAVRQGKLSAPAAFKDRIDASTPTQVERETGVSADKVKAAVEALDGNGVVVTSHSLFDRNHALDTLELLASLAQGTTMQFNCYALGGNDVGAEMLGVLPDSGPNNKPISSNAGLGTFGVLRAAAEAKLDALWLVESNPITDSHDKALSIRALENVPFLVVQASQASEIDGFASVILPMDAPAEQDGTYTNLEGTVQRMSQILRSTADSKQCWRIFAELLLRATPIKPFFNAREVMEEIASEVDCMSESMREALGSVVHQVGQARTEEVIVERN